MVKFGALLALVISALIAGCAAKGLEPSALPEFEPRHQARVVWSASTGISKRYIFSPAHLGDSVCAAGHAGRVSCFDIRSGRRIWTVSTGVPLSGGVGVSGNVVLVGTAKGEVIAYSANGKLLWRSKLSSEILSAPVGSRSTIVVRTGDSKVFGLDAKDGKRIWEYQAPTQPLVLRSNPGMVLVDGDAVIGGSPGGLLTKLALKDGGLLWQTVVAIPRGDNELERVADIAGTPLVESDRVCAVTFQGRVGCYDTEKGSQIWARSASSAGSLSADSRSVYYTESDGTVVALDRSTGASVWRQNSLLHRRVSSPLVIDDWIVVGDFEGYVHVLSRDDGSFVARVRTDGSDIIAAPIQIDKQALVLTQAGRLYSIAFDG